MRLLLLSTFSLFSFYSYGTSSFDEIDPTGNPCVGCDQLSEYFNYVSDVLTHKSFDSSSRGGKEVGSESVFDISESMAISRALFEHARKASISGCKRTSSLYLSDVQLEHLPSVTVFRLSSGVAQQLRLMERGRNSIFGLNVNRGRTYVVKQGDLIAKIKINTDGSEEVSIYSKRPADKLKNRISDIKMGRKEMEKNPYLVGVAFFGVTPQGKKMRKKIQKMLNKVAFSYGKVENGQLKGGVKGASGNIEAAYKRKNIQVGVKTSISKNSHNVKLNMTTDEGVNFIVGQGKSNNVITNYTHLSTKINGVMTMIDLAQSPSEKRASQSLRFLGKDGVNSVKLSRYTDEKADLVDSSVEYSYNKEGKSYSVGVGKNSYSGARLSLGYRNSESEINYYIDEEMTQGSYKKVHPIKLKSLEGASWGYELHSFNGKADYVGMTFYGEFD